MAYQYRPTLAEDAAAALLRARGWSVAEPSCPLCQGMGTVGHAEEGPSTRTPDGRFEQSWTYSSLPCPNGCVLAAWYSDPATFTPTDPAGTPTPEETPE